VTSSPICEFDIRLDDSQQSRVIQVRRATEDDRLSIFKMSAAMHRETDFSHFTFDPKTAIDGIGQWLHGGDRQFMLVATLGGHVIGMLGVVMRPVWFGPDVMASEEIFYVKPDHRGSRAAFKLMGSFIHEAKDLGARHVRAGVATGSSKAAEKLYQHFGLHYVGGNFSGHF
jgi:GNAT superfamily N-acetyltransferase